jgi:hypothetical protein
VSWKNIVTLQDRVRKSFEAINKLGETAQCQRKEYFRVPLEKIIDLVTQHHSKFDFHQTADAGDFRKTLAIRAEREAMIFGKAAHASALSRVDEVKARFEQLKKATA